MKPIDHPPASPATTSSLSLDTILSAASEQTRETVRVLGEILGNEPLAMLPPTQFAVPLVAAAAAVHSRGCHG